MQTLRIACLFLLSAQITTLGGWLFSLGGAASRIAGALALVAIVTYAVAWIGDDAIARYLGSDLLTYHGILLVTAIAFLLGVGIWACIQIG